MRPNLDTLRTEIQERLEGEGFAIFYGHSRMMDSQPLVFWDTEHHPNYQDFLQTAKAAGAKVVVLNQREFSADVIEDAIEQLAVSDLPPDDQRTIERRLKELRVYEGFTCSIELSFDLQGRIYMFDIQTDWYEELNNLLEDLEFLDDGDDDVDTGQDTIGGYFSKN